jgi:hypothetical protein
VVSAEAHVGFWVVSYVESQKLPRPECFISYAWGNKEQERWVERNLATDLQKAGIGVVLDRWENARVGASVSRFVERIERCDRVIMVGTPLYRKKYDNKDTSRGYVVAAEVDVISNRLLGTEVQKETVLPLLLAGQKTSSLPPLLHSRVFADFRDERAYFTTAFDLILDLYGISHSNPAVADLRESLQESEMQYALIWPTEKDSPCRFGMGSCTVALLKRYGATHGNTVHEPPMLGPVVVNG